MKKTTCLLVSFVLIFSFFLICAGCSANESMAESTTTIQEIEANSTLGNTTTVSPPEIIHSDDITVPEFIQFENPFDILDNPNVEVVQPKEKMDILNVLDEMGFTDIDLFKNTKKDTVHIGIAGDVVVAQFEVLEDNLVWTVRMEKANSLENRTGLVIPDDASVIDWSYDCYEALNYNWFNPSADIELDIVYCPETNNLYSFYIETNWLAGEDGYFNNPSLRAPTTVVLDSQDKDCERTFGRDFFLNSERVD